MLKGLEPHLFSGARAKKNHLRSVLLLFTARTDDSEHPSSFAPMILATFCMFSKEMVPAGLSIQTLSTLEKGHGMFQPQLDRSGAYLKMLRL